ncbi:MAG: TrbI/VirB10 family protein [Verrucomicrobiota bacterium]
MTPRKLLNACRTRTGAIVVFLILFAVVFMLTKGFGSPRDLLAKLERKPGARLTRKPQVVESVSRDMTTFNAPAEVAAPSTPLPEVRKPEGSAELIPLSLYSEAISTMRPVEGLGREFAPFGRMVQCELVITVESSSMNTPIVGLVTVDVWHNGRLIIPAGTEVHATARVDRVRERIASSGNWTFVWQSGEELSLSGLVLDREKDDARSEWGITDGSAGLRGELLKSDDLAELKLFTATFLGGASSGLTEKEQSIFGSQTVNSFQNAPLVGAQQVLNVYAKQILETIQRDGFYVRVPAGKQFYVYVTQTIDKSKAVIGGTRLALLKASEVTEKEDLNDPIARLRRNLMRLAAPNTAAVDGDTAPLTPAQIAARK